MTATTPTTPARNVLIVDDDRALRHAITALLQSAGYRTDQAGDGPEALAKLRQQPVDLMLLDIGLPQLDGYAVARRLREEAGQKPLRLIALTGYGQDEDRHQAEEAGFDAYLVKPGDPDTLRRLLA